MSKGMKIALGSLVTLQLGLCVWYLVAQPLDGCVPCRIIAAKYPFGWIGLAWYSLIATLLCVPSSKGAASLACAVAAGSHSYLAGVLLLGGAVCWICFATAVISIGLWALTSSVRKAEPLSLVASGILGLTLAAVVGHVANEFQRPMRWVLDLTPSRDAKVTLFLVEGPNCPECQTFRAEYVPLLKRDLPQVQVSYVSADQLPEKVATPMLLLKSGSHTPFMYDRLPSYSLLRAKLETWLED